MNLKKYTFVILYSHSTKIVFFYNQLALEIALKTHRSSSKHSKCHNLLDGDNNLRANLGNIPWLQDHDWAVLIKYIYIGYCLFSIVNSELII